MRNWDHPSEERWRNNRVNVYFDCRFIEPTSVYKVLCALYRFSPGSYVGFVSRNPCSHVENCSCFCSLFSKIFVKPASVENDNFLFSCVDFDFLHRWRKQDRLLQSVLDYREGWNKAQFADSP